MVDMQHRSFAVPPMSINNFTAEDISSKIICSKSPIQVIHIHIEKHKHVAVEFLVQSPRPKKKRDIMAVIRSITN